MGTTVADIYAIALSIYELARERIANWPENTAIICGKTSADLHLQFVGSPSLHRLVYLFPVENVGTEDYDVSAILFSQENGESKSKQYIYIPARINGLVHTGLGNSVRRTNAQIANQIANFILTGEMEFKKE